MYSQISFMVAWSYNCVVLCFPNHIGHRCHSAVVVLTNGSLKNSITQNQIYSLSFNYFFHLLFLEKVYIESKITSRENFANSGVCMAGDVETCSVEAGTIHGDL